MKIHAFKVVQRGATPLVDLLRKLEAQLLQDRNYVVDGRTIKLEEVLPAKDGSWRLDLSKTREYGPGRVSTSRPMADFALAHDEGFGEETAAYYDPKSDYMTIQYNHYGPRAGTYESYFFSALHAFGDHGGGIGLIPVMSPKVAGKISKFNVFKKFQLTCYLPGLDTNTLKSRPSMAELVKQPLAAGAETLRIDLSAEKARPHSLVPAFIRQLIDDFSSVPDQVERLKVTGKADPFAPSEMIDLLEARLETDVQISRGGYQRFPAQMRWQELKKIHDEWRANGSLK
jgi:hypothetical protein